MIEMKIASIRANIMNKLNMIKFSNTLYYHKHKTEYERCIREFKKYGMKDTEEHLEALESLLENLDDLVRGAD